MVARNIYLFDKSFLEIFIFGKPKKFCSKQDWSGDADQEINFDSPHIQNAIWNNEGNHTAIYDYSLTGNSKQRDQGVKKCEKGYILKGWPIGLGLAIGTIINGFPALKFVLV